jgi:hypothetical protein
MAIHMVYLGVVLTTAPLWVPVLYAACGVAAGVVKQRGGRS